MRTPPPPPTEVLEKKNNAFFLETPMMLARRILDKLGFKGRETNSTPFLKAVS